MSRGYLAFDGGNSKTDVVAGTADGRVLAYLRGPRCLHYSIEWPESVRRLCELADRARRAAGPGCGAAPAHAQLFLAGINQPDERDWFTAALRGRLAQSVVVGNDAFAPLRAGDAAIAVVCGAGSNCVGRDPAGRTVQFCALGPLSGDWGGGPDLGLAALGEAVRGEDGRGRPTVLSTLVAEHFGLPTATHTAVAMQRTELSRDRLIELVPPLLRAAAGSDAVALAVVDRLAAEVSTMAGATADRLGLGADPFGVVLAGRVLRDAPGPIQERIAGQVRARLPPARVEVLRVPPVLGSALAALDTLEASDAPDALATPPARSQAATCLRGYFAGPVTPEVVR
jgi:N-acetylglucosamine kinase-like BadF-type ATPase